VDATPLTPHNFFETVEGIVAFATLLLALVTSGLAAATVVMAAKTKRLADSTAQEIDVSTRTLAAIQRQSASAEAQVGVGQRSLAATFRPVLVSIPHGWSGFSGGEGFRYINGPAVQLDPINRWVVHAIESAERFYFSVPTRNAGEGIAFVGRARLYAPGREGVVSNGDAVNALVPPGETTRILFSLPPNLEIRPGFGKLFVHIPYEDLGGNMWETIFNASRANDGRWWVERVRVAEEGASEDEVVDSGDMPPP
jgi:hypothetical protein